MAYRSWSILIVGNSLHGGLLLSLATYIIPTHISRRQMRWQKKKERNMHLAVSNNNPISADSVFPVNKRRKLPRWDVEALKLNPSIPLLVPRYYP
jgi:hypothetical protein